MCLRYIIHPVLFPYLVSGLSGAGITDVMTLLCATIFLTFLSAFVVYALASLTKPTAVLLGIRLLRPRGTDGGTGWLRPELVLAGFEDFEDFEEAPQVQGAHTSKTVEMNPSAP